MKNKILEVQEILLEEMRRLDKETIDSIEIARSNALSNNATTYIKAVNTSLRIKELASKNEQTIESINEELGVI